ncbi:MAG: SDR family oxidoreductase [Proteobacteria bacterium]|nr:SDR family oxidoreductase [Pseudomonadota bacterium]
MKLKDRVAVITGSSSGLALASARRFISEGAFVYVTGRRHEQLQSAAKELGPRARAIQGDVSRMEDLDRLFALVQKEHGSLDILFASAGAGAWQTLGSITEDQVDTTLNVNIKGTVFTVQKALPLLKRGASVILTGSAIAHKGFAGLSVYGATKAALRSLIRHWIVELKDREIRFNVLSPGSIDTAALAPLSEDMRSYLKSIAPMGRLGEPDEIATAALFLASDDSRYITGSEIFVDGGYGQV